MQQPDRTWDDWHAEGRRRFGWHFDGWWFACPECGLAFTVGRARAVGVYEHQLGRLCPVALGGCGFPQTMGTKLAAGARVKLLGAGERARLHRMVGISKDDPKRVKMRYFPFCPADQIPADGQPAKVGEVSDV